MAWFKIDDSSHMHPKIVKAGNAALGLWVRAGAYSAQHLTEGTVPAVVARQYGTAPQARKLVSVGLWHEHGHTCPRCPQPPVGDFMVHDFFEGGRNSTRAQVEANRAAAAERKAKSRTRNERGSATNQTRNAPQFQQESPGQEGVSHRDAVDSITASQASTKPYPSTSSGSRGEQASPDGPRIAEPVRPLVDAMSAAGMVVSWELSSAEWLLLHALIERCGVQVLVDHAGGAWQAARTRPRSARYFVSGWRSLPTPPPRAPGAGPKVVPLNPGAARPSTTDQRVRAGLDLAAQLREQENAQ
ncbi:mucin-2 [Streptomyces vinaceus]|uniref:mucin-2 n=1 Tax=Streptomyces vinaceus TaxID=1960 RepID=UPI0038177402